MSAAFDYILEYEVGIRCTSPLRTGSTYGGIEDVLRDPDGIPFYQASSLAGALRDWLTVACGIEEAQKLFGSSAKAGALTFTDLRFAPGTDTALRPRLRIDWQTGAAANGAKYDVANLPTGSRGSFTMTWYGQEKGWKAAHDSITKMLSALHAGQVRLGAQKSNGFGQVCLQVSLRRYCMTQAADRENWLNRTQVPGQPVTLPQLPPADLLRFVVEAKTDSILVKASTRKYIAGKNTSIPITENNTPILPGSSIKGALRSRVLAVARRVGVPDETVNAAFGRESDRRSSGKDNGIAGKLRFSDAKLNPPGTTAISRIRIDRLTGGTVSQGLFTEQPLCSPVTMVVEAPIRGHEQVCALLVFALRDLGLGLYNLGSGGSVGRGRMAVRSVTITHPDWSACMTFENGQMQLSDPQGGLNTLLDSLKGGATV